LPARRATKRGRSNCSRRAAAAGHTRAQINLGILYLRGLGVPRDIVNARAWLEKAAASGDPQALYTLGRAMDEGSEQIAPDPVRAADLYRRAAEKGHVLAGLRYGLALSEGIGIKRDVAAAQKWLVQARDNGVPEAALAMGDMAARTPASRDKAANERTVQTAVSWYEVAAHGRRAVGPVQARQRLLLRRRRGARSHAGHAVVQPRRAAGAAASTACTGHHADGRRQRGARSDRGLQVAAAGREGRQSGFALGPRQVRRQLSEKDRRQAETLAQRFVPTLERPIDDGSARAVVQKPASGR
jgi:TPR repeat protein